MKKNIHERLDKIEKSISINSSHIKDIKNNHLHSMQNDITSIQDDVSDIKHILLGKKGTNGLVAEIVSIKASLDIAKMKNFIKGVVYTIAGVLLVSYGIHNGNFDVLIKFLLKLIGV
ncbi:MAG: hypothetical protein ACTSXD_08480 [Candidatus Heimdallarchaeaceae archaeon]